MENTGNSSKMKNSQKQTTKKESNNVKKKTPPDETKKEKNDKPNQKNKTKKEESSSQKEGTIPNTEKNLSEKENNLQKNKDNLNKAEKMDDNNNHKSKNTAYPHDDINENSGTYGNTGNYGSTGSYGTAGNYGNEGYSGKTGSHGNSGKYGSASTYGSSYGYGYGYDNSYGYGHQIKVNGIFGFQNNKVTNNCFMNSSLQNLLHCDEFTKLLHSIPDHKLTNKPLTREVKNIINQINKGDDELDPTKIKSILSEVEEKYRYNEQNDANEFITIFLNQLLKELNGIGENEYVTGNIPDNELEMKAFYKLEDRFFLQNKSFLLNLFYGRLKRVYKCESGHTCLVKFNNFNTLILPQPVQSNNIIDLLILYQKGKLINDTIFCQKCQRDVKYSIETKIYSIPKYFILCLEKETAYYSSGIDYPPILKTEKFMQNSYGNYRLNSLIEYSGNRKSGHYTAKVCQDNKWYSISDSYYRSINEADIYYKSAIILFYSN